MCWKQQYPGKGEPANLELKGLSTWSSWFLLIMFCCIQNAYITKIVVKYIFVSFASPVLLSMETFCYFSVDVFIVIA